jgi:hypothetical protein
MLSAIPGFWPAVIALGVLAAALLLPGLSILAGLVLVQFAAYRVGRYMTALRVAVPHGDERHFQAQVIKRD